MKRQLREVAWVVAGQAGTALGTLIGVRILTQFLSPDDYGIVTLATGLSVLATNLVAAPITQAAVHFYPGVVAIGSASELLAAVLRGHRAMTPGSSRPCWQGRYLPVLAPRLSRAVRRVGIAVRKRLLALCQSESARGRTASATLRLLDGLRRLVPASRCISRRGVGRRISRDGSGFLSDYFRVPEHPSRGLWPRDEKIVHAADVLASWISECGPTLCR